ncbi:MAG: TonB-dependent receptor, partial [Flavobacteriia bacterium]
MKDILIVFTLFFNLGFMMAQTTVSGTVTDAKKNPIEGANVYVEGTYDGASTDKNGHFSFETPETGTQTLVVSMLSYESHYEIGDIVYFKDLKKRFGAGKERKSEIKLFESISASKVIIANKKLSALTEK